MKKPEVVEEYCGIKQLPKKKIDKYVAAQGQFCPSCESKDIRAYGSTCERIGNMCYENVTCNTCKFEWTDEYVLSGITQ